MATLGCITLSHWTVWNSYLDRAITLHSQFAESLDGGVHIPDAEAWKVLTQEQYIKFCELVAAFVVFQSEADGHFAEHETMWNNRSASWQQSPAGVAVRAWLDGLWELANKPFDEPKLSLRIFEALKPDRFPATVQLADAFDLDSYDDLLEDAGFFQRDAGPDSRLTAVSA